MNTICPPSCHYNDFVANSCTWVHDEPYIMCCVQVYELPQSHSGENREGILRSLQHIYYAHLTSVRFEHSVCRGSLMTTYTYIYDRNHF